MGRTAKHMTGPAVGTAASGVVGGWCNGHWSGKKETREAAQKAADEGLIVELFGCELVCDSVTPLGAIASLAAWNPGQTIVTKCPPEVADYFKENSRYV